MADLKQVRYQRSDGSYADDLRTWADASSNLNTALPTGAKRRLLDALGRVISEIDEATGDVVRTRFSDAADGPTHTLRHDSASPAVDDVIGRFAFQARNDAGGLYTGAELRAIVKNAAAGAEEVWFEAGIMNAGTFVPSGLSLRVVGGAVKLFIDGVEAGTGGGGGGGVFSGARVYNSAAISIPHNTPTVLTFDSERWDTDGYHNPATNPSRLTAPVDGYYHVRGQIFWQTINNTSREVYIRLDGTTIISERDLSLDNRGAGVSTIYQLVAGQYCELAVYQSSGSSITITQIAEYSPEFLIYKID